MNPAVPFKSCLAFMLRCKKEMYQSLSLYVLRIQHFVIVKIIAVITDRANKLLIKYRYEIAVEVYVLINAAKELGNAFIVYTDGFGAFKNFTAPEWRFLVIIIRDGFCKVYRQKSSAFFRGINII